MDEKKLEKATDIGAAIAVWALTAVCVEGIAFLTWVWCAWF